jgi:hypothetical protein
MNGDCLMSIYDEYRIVINEGQRRLIMRALTNALPTIVARRAKAVRFLVQAKMNICSLFACSARLNRLSANRCHDFAKPARLLAN